MNKEKLSWGLILLFVGGVLLLENLGVIDFYWRSVFNMWPIILIVIGVNLLVPKRGIGPAISVVVTIAALSFLAFRGTFPPHSHWWTFDNNDWKSEKRMSNDSGQTREKTSGMFTQEYDSAITTANLHIKGGAVAYEIDGRTDKLFQAEAISTFGGHHLKTTTTGTEADLIFRMRDTGKGDWNMRSNENRAKISLNNKPIWRISLDMGAGTAEFDLTEYKVARLSFKGGAASFEAKLGMPVDETVVTAESGAASVEIEIPRAAACRINVKSGLSSKDFPGFNRQADGSYTTEGYEDASNRFVVNLKGGLSSFSVKRYD